MYSKDDTVTQNVYMTPYLHGVMEHVAHSFEQVNGNRCSSFGTKSEAKG